MESKIHELERNDNQPPTGFTQIPNELIRNPDLGDGEFRTYVNLDAYAFNDKVICWPSEERQAKDLGVNVRTIRRRLRKLESAGLIETVPDNGRVNIYRIKKKLKPSASGTPDTDARGGRTPVSAEEDEVKKTKSSLRAPDGGQGEKGEGTETPAEPVPLSGQITQPLSGQGLVSDLVRVLAASGYELPPGRRGQFGGVFKQLIAKGVTPEEFANIIGHIVARWPDKELLPNDAQTELCGEHTGRTGSAPEVVQALKNYENEGRTDLRRYAGVARRFDFTSEEDPDWRVMKELGNDYDTLARLRSVARRAVREARRAVREAQVAELNATPTTEEPTQGATLPSSGLEGVHEGTGRTPEQEAEARALIEAVEWVMSNPESNALRLARSVVRGATDGAGNPIERTHVVEALKDELDLDDCAREAASIVVLGRLRQQQREEVPTA